MKYIFFVIIILPLQLIGQDFHMSQYDAAALNVNPAFTGQFRGDMRVHGHYRNQWKAIAHKPFTTYLMSLDFNKGKWAFGGQIANFNAGLGGYNQMSVLPSVAYHHLVGRKRIHKMSYGVQVGAFQKSVNPDNLTFQSQYVETNGGDFNTTLPNGEAFGATSTFNLDVNLGIIYTYANRLSRINPFIGLTAYHVNLPKESFLDADNQLPVRFQLHAGSRVAISDRISITPRFFIQYQDKVDEITYGFLGHYHLKNPNFFLLMGATYRSQKDAVIAEVGAKYGSFIGRISYDINLSSLTTISNGRGASEFSLTYVFSKPKKYPLEKCPKIP